MQPIIRSRVAADGLRVYTTASWESTQVLKVLRTQRGRLRFGSEPDFQLRIWRANQVSKVRAIALLGSQKRRKESTTVVGWSEKLGETNSAPGQPNLHRAGSGGGDRTYEKRSRDGLRPLLWGWPTLTPRGCTILCLPSKTPSCNRTVTLVRRFKCLLQRDRTEEITCSPSSAAWIRMAGVRKRLLQLLGCSSAWALHTINSGGKMRPTLFRA